MGQHLVLVLVVLLMLGGSLGWHGQAKAFQPRSLAVQAQPESSPFSRRPGVRTLSRPGDHLSPSYIYVYPFNPSSPYEIARPPASYPYGYLRLDVRPADAEIYVDGSLIGHSRDATAPTLLPVVAGGHGVVLRWQEFGMSLRLFVAEGETVAVSYDLTSLYPAASAHAVKRWSIPPSGPRY